MADPTFFPVESTRTPKPPLRKHASTTPESRCWRSFKNSHLSSGHIHAVTSLDFSPSYPHDLAASVSASVLLFDGKTASSDLSPKPFSPISHFSDVAYSPSFRFDGALLAAGGETGLVQIFDPNKNRPVLRRLRGHSRAVRVVRYPRIADKAHVFSGGDDALLNYWDTATETRVLSFSGAHKDYIRAGAASPMSPEVFATGSYDHTVRLWDVRVGSDVNAAAVARINHGSPVESVIFLPSGGLAATAGGNCIKIWDVIGGGKLIHSMESHNKTVTSICIGKMGKKVDGNAGGESRILSVSIDGYLKVFDYSTFKVTHSMRYPSMLLSVALSPTGLVQVVGTSNGVIHVGKKVKKDKMDVASGIDMLDDYRSRAILKPTFYRYFQRGQNEKPSDEDYVVKRPAKVKLAEHDKLLKKFRHKEALVSALKKKNPGSIMAVIEELVSRKKLFRCVENLDEEELGLLLGFLHKYATVPRYARYLMGLGKKVLQMRLEDIKKSDELKQHVRNIKRMIAEEIKIQHSLQEIEGMLSPLLRLAKPFSHQVPFTSVFAST